MFCGAGISNGLTGAELGVSWLLPRAVGTSSSAEILLTGKQGRMPTRRDRIGLVSQVLADDEVLDAAVAMAEGMCAFSPFGLALTKDTLWAVAGGGEPPGRRRPGEPDPAAGRSHRQPRRGRGGLQGEASPRLHRVAGRPVAKARRGGEAPRPPRGTDDRRPGRRRAGSTGGPTVQPKTALPPPSEANRSLLQARLEDGVPSSTPTGAASAGVAPGQPARTDRRAPIDCTVQTV